MAFPYLAKHGKLPQIGAMETSTETQTVARLEARLPANVYALLKRAAALKGRSITDFVVSAAQDAAQRVIEDESIIRLSTEDQVRFAQALLKPPLPNAALKRAMRQHKKSVEVR